MAPPAAVFAPLLTESLNGFAILDSREHYVYASASLCNLLSLSKDVLLGCEALARSLARARWRRSRCMQRAAVRCACVF